MADNNSLPSGEASLPSKHNDEDVSSNVKPEEAYKVDRHQQTVDDESLKGSGRRYYNWEGRRPSYEYAREEKGLPQLRPKLSRQISHHDSAITAIGLLRFRNAETNKSFQHPLSDQKTGQDVLVDFDSKDDPYRPQNWPFLKKVLTTMLYSLTTAGATLASSVLAPGLRQITEQFDISEEVSQLAISLLLFGFALGPMLWAPLSEVYGRKPAVLIPFFFCGVFSFATAVSKDIQTVMITRFFTGFFGSAPITNTGGALGDMWPPQQRGIAIVGYAMAVLGGPTLGPLIGGILVVKEPIDGWRWTQYGTGIYCMLILVLDLIFVDESSAPTLLTYKARRLRYETGNYSLHASHEEWDVSINDLARKYLVRPFQLLGTPICLLMSVYGSFVYGMLYANLSSFPIAFEDYRGWNPIVGAMPFIALLVGILLGAVVVLWNAKYYFKQYEANGNRAVPEARLPSMMIGGVVFTAGMFIFGWTSESEFPWIAPIIGCALIGFGFFTIFQATINYLVDTFQQFGASAVATSTFLRSAFSGIFPLFITPMYRALGVDLATTIFGCLGALAIPIPFLFYFYGKRIRARGVWSKESVE